MQINELPTPCLVVDLDLVERNIQKMSDYCRSVKCNLRPHVKAHKNSFIGKKQLEAGAIGLCAQTLDEAEAMIIGGLDHVLLTNMLISKSSVERFLSLAHNSDTITTVDSLEGVEVLGKAATRRGLKVGVLVEIDVGQKRTGVEPGDSAAKLAGEVARTPGLEFRGLMGYEGFLQLSIPEFEKRKVEVHKALSGITKSIAALRKVGFEPEIVTSGGTGTYNITAEFEGVTEIQPGSYVTMDHMYHKMETCGTDFNNSLTVHSTVVSTSNDRVVIDMGWKAASVEYQLFGWDGMAHPVDLDGATYFPGGDEHGILKFSEGTRRPGLGDRVKFIPSHCDTTLNLYGKFYAVRGNKVELVCPIARR